MDSLVFRDFFRALWGREPFRWQVLLAERVAAGEWPAIIDLPTACGKTACIDIALYALARQADVSLTERTAPRRIWFVVDRRLVVDEAFTRASRIAESLASAKDGILREIADRLRGIAGTDRPLAVGRLRGGVLHDDGWAYIPSQPTVITSTVDQLGSRLLFRGYGRSLLTAPIFAGLAAHDALIILDEAHCSVPFLQTLQGVQRLRGAEWSDEPIISPFGFVSMSATRPLAAASGHVFPGHEHTDVLSDEALTRRLTTSKPARLVVTRDKRSSDSDPLVAELCENAVALVQNGCRRVAIMVNRVATAYAVDTLLRSRLPNETIDVVLMTGRMRIFDRDTMVTKWTPVLRAEQPLSPSRPVVVVATQCLEVGADFSFDGLVTECASLDALQQRFGRLARLGADSPAPAVVAIRESDIEPKKPDPVYGDALSATWRWLCEQAESDQHGHRVVDFSVASMRTRLGTIEDFASLLAPVRDAPLLLPAHLDLLSQTSPPPHPQPDVAQFLHGQPQLPEVSLVVRCDLTVDPAVWPEIVALCPPVSGEMLSVPLWRVRRWLAEADASNGTVDTDIENVGNAAATGDEQGSRSRTRPFLIWQGRDRSRVSRQAADILPGDVIVVPASYAPEALGQFLRERAVGEEQLDIWESARLAAGQPAAVRLTEPTLRPWRSHSLVGELLSLVTDSAPDREAIRSAILALIDAGSESGDDVALPAALREMLSHAVDGDLIEHPGGGVIICRRSGGRRESEIDMFADDDDVTSAVGRQVTLEDHSRATRRAAERISQHCLPKHLWEPVIRAAYWHDVGKLDPRFQFLLWHGDEIRAALADEPIAKSAHVPMSPTRRTAIRQASGLPESFRHEALSAILAARYQPASIDGAISELILHLIESHHGHARPWMPVSLDVEPPDVEGALGDTAVRLTGAERAQLQPAHHIGSGSADRFWRLTRRYGWWGLAYLEAIVRLSDWYASRIASLEV